MAELYERRLAWLKRADKELADLGAPAINLARAEAHWEEAWEALVESVVDEYGTEFSEEILLAHVSAYDVALIALALAAQERDEGWYDVILGRFIDRYRRRIDRAREQRALPNVRLSLRHTDVSDADPGL
jgi:hypothetical protein